MVDIGRHAFKHVRRGINVDTRRLAGVVHVRMVIGVDFVILELGKLRAFVSFVIGQENFGNGLVALIIKFNVVRCPPAIVYKLYFLFLHDYSLLLVYES
jgi:hypothetical protein